LDAALVPVDTRSLLASGCDVEIDIGDFGAALEHNAMALQPLNQGQHQRFILVVLGEFQNGFL
jgi:hypothetical protein